MVAPAVPPPQTIPHPAPRVVWAGDVYRLQALDWDDGHPCTYSVVARHGRHWQPASGEETLRCLFALAAWLDQVRGEHTPGGEGAD